MNKKLLLYVILLVVFTAAYIVAAEIGFVFEVGITSISPVWPAAAIALGILLTRGYRFFPAIFFGASVSQTIHLVVTNDHSIASAIIISTVVAAGCTASALTGAVLLKTFIKKTNVIERVWDVVKFVALAAIFSTMIGATITTFALSLSGIIPEGEFGYLWWTWWTGAGVGILLIVPVMITCCVRPEIFRSPQRLFEAGLFAAFFLIVHQLAVGNWIPQLLATHPLDNILPPFFLFLLLVAVLRFKQFGSSAFVFLAWILFVWDTANGVGPFVRDGAVESMLTLEASMGLLAVTMMTLTATMNELNHVVIKLRKSKGQLEERVEERTVELTQANLGLEREVTDRRNAEEQLRISGLKLKAQYKGIPIPTYTWQRVDSDFELVDYNDAAETITRGSVVKLLGKKASELYADTPEVIEDMAKCFMEKTVVKHELLYRFRSTPETRVLDTTYAYVPPDLVLAHTDDITERKQAEEQIVRQSADLEERATELTALNEVSAAISRSIDLDDLLMHVLKTITNLDLFNVEHKGGVFVIEDDRMRLAAHLGHPEEFLAQHANMKLGDCLCGKVAQSGEIIVSGNSDHDDRHEIRYDGMKPHGHVIVPLKMANRVVGVSYFYFPADFRISSRKLELLTTIGNQLGVAIENARLFGETKRLSLHDALTGLANRNLMNAELAKTFKQSQRSRMSLSLIMMDLDHFKEFNDTYGHAAGDKLLVDVAEVIKRAIREVDVAVRYGGEEFLIILPGTDADKATEVAERLRKAIEEKEFHHDECAPVHITVSLGVATSSEDVAMSNRLVMMADDALYEAKRNGRNQVKVWNGGGYSDVMAPQIGAPKDKGFP